MKNGIVFFLCLFIYVTSGAQVGIGTATPDASAQLDVSSTSRGFLPPRMIAYIIASGDPGYDEDTMFKHRNGSA